MALPWIRVDTNLPSHDKILDLLTRSTKGKGAAFAYVCSIAWSAGQGTDGFIPKAALGFIHCTPAEAKLLVESRLWEYAEGGWTIRNFATRQPITATTDAVREARKQAGRKGAEARWGHRDDGKE